MLKNQRVSFYVSALAAACALAALIAFAVTNSTLGYGIKNSTAVFACTVVSLALCVCSILAQAKDINELIVSAMRIVALVLIMIAMTITLEDRAVVAGGLFTWNSLDVYAWNAFYTGIACIVLQMLVAVLLVISGCMKQGTKAA